MSVSSRGPLRALRAQHQRPLHELSLGPGDGLRQRPSARLRDERERRRRERSAHQGAPQPRVIGIGFMVDSLKLGALSAGRIAHAPVTAAADDIGLPGTSRVPGCTRIPSDDAGTLCARVAICVTRGYMKA
jgi:hypothetical protein